MHHIFKKGKNNKAFTLAELLIVIAIIAVIVAIAIPIFTSQLEKSREATDLANIRSAYAEVKSKAMTEEESQSVQVDLEQTQAGWVLPTAEDTLNAITNHHVVGAPGSGDHNAALVEWNAEDLEAVITFNGEGSGGGHSGGGSDSKDESSEGESEGGGSGGGGGGSGSKYPMDTKKEKMESVAKSIKETFDDISPENFEKLKGAMWCPAGSYEYAGYQVEVKELGLSEDRLKKFGYWENGELHSWGSLLEKTGLDTTKLSDILQDGGGYIYFDKDFKPTAVSYYTDKSTSNTYRYVFLGDGKVVEMNSMPGGRQCAGNYEEYALKIGKEVTE